MRERNAIGRFIESDRTCNLRGCNEKHHAKGLCHQHYDEQWRKKNKKRYLKSNKQYSQNNKKEITTWKKQWRKENKEHIAKCNKEYYKTPAGRASIKAGTHNRRALTKDLTTATIQQVYEDNIKKFGTLTCVLCFKWVTLGDENIDHLTPLSRGGSNALSNLGIAHSSCNSQKYTMTLEEWFEKKKRG